MKRIAIALLTIGVSAISPSLSIARVNPTTILGGEYKNGMEPSKTNVTNPQAVASVAIGGRNALQINLDYAWKGDPLDWDRLGSPGFAQRVQFVEKPGVKARSGRDYWYSVSFLVPSSDPRVQGHSLSLMDFKHTISADGSVPSVQLAIQAEGFKIIENLDSPWTCGSYRNVDGYQTPACNRIDTNAVISSQAGVSDRWVQVVMHARWDAVGGVLEIWIDGKPIMGFSGDTLRGAQNVQYKFGPYRHHMTGDPGVETIYYSGVSRAATCELLGTVDCSAVAARPPNPGLQNVSRIHHDVFNELDEMHAQGR